MTRCLAAVVCCAFICSFAYADDEQSLAAAGLANPWYPDKDFPALITPQWVGEEGVEAVVVLAIDDMRDSAKYEQYLRPILDRLKRIDGRAPVSIMTNTVRLDDTQLQSWLAEGLSIECHSIDHPCPLLQGGDFAKARSTYDRCVDLMGQIPGNTPVAFRMPCCDSLNTVSPRFYAEIFNKKTDTGNYLQIDSSVMNFFTSDDPSIPRELVLDQNGEERFWKYKVRNLKRGDTVHDHFVNYIRNYPYPYVINNTCWQFPCVAPSDWSAQHLHGVNNQVTVDDWKAALDITVHKQGVFNLVFHPHGWIKPEQVVELIDHAVTKHGRKVKFLNFKEAAERLNQSQSRGQPLRAARPPHQPDPKYTTWQTQLAAESDADRKVLQHVLANPIAFSLPPIRRPDGTHNGFFIHEREFCWQNEDTAHRPDLIERVSFDRILAAHRRDEIRRALPPVPIGAAVVDITPAYPVRLTGYGNRMTESEGVAAAIHARALAIGEAPNTKPVAGRLSPDGGCCVLITVDNCGVPAEMTETVFARLSEKYKLSRERFAISSTHSHSAPWLRGFAPTIFAEIPEDHAAHLARYETELLDKLVEVAEQAILSQHPGHLSYGFGATDFAMNRRTLTDGKWTGFGEAPDGPTDNRVPVLAAHDTNGRLIAVLANYACHCTTETGSFNQISGDWAGFAADLLEAQHPAAVALIVIGCGADANPSPRGTHEQAKQHGRTMADEVTRILNSGNSATKPDPQNSTPVVRLRAITPQVACNMTRIDLPLGPLPSRETWEQKATQPGAVGAHAKYFLQLLDNGQSIPTTIPDYPVQTWCFGDDLAMVFLGGEVVVDYSIRLNDMFDGDRLWINAYSNDVPCYIASARLLREGGYECDSSMVYYRRPTRLAPEAEDVICDAVQKLMPHEFYSEKLQRDFPAPKSPQDSLECMTTKPELRVVLAASEPLIRDPVAFDWDERGRLWVVEMSDYPLGASRNEGGGARGNQTARSGRVQILDDTDHDGVYESATTFLDGLAFPNGIHCWRNGAIITMAPEIFYAEDSDGDGSADVREILYKGFTEGNQQHRVNGLRWGLDGWLYLANGDSGGEISGTGVRLAGAVSAAPVPESPSAVSLRGRDLKIDPDSNGVEAVSGQTQFGRERNDFGQWFGNNNSNPIWQFVLEDRYVRRNPHAGISQVTAPVAVVPGAAPVFPTSRTLARFNDFGFANRFTSACSTMIYRDSLLGEPFAGNAFTSEPVHNLVSRLVMKRDGFGFQGQRSSDEQNSEFLASSDNWFRPTMIRTGPDGAVWVADMYRAAIEHPEWIPPEYQRKMNLYAGNDKGRIYRILPVGECCGNSNSSADRKAPDADFRTRWNEIPMTDLIARLESRNGWWRDTAQRILQHRRDDAIADAMTRPTLARMATSSRNVAVRVQALATLAMLFGDLETSELLAALIDGAPEVRSQAIELSERRLQQGDKHIAGHLTQLADDSDKAVQLQLLLTLGYGRDPASARLLGRLLQRNFDAPILRSAGLSSLSPDNLPDVLQETLSEAPDQPHEKLLGLLLAQAAAFGQSDLLGEPLSALLVSIKPDSPTARLEMVAKALSDVSRGKAHAALVAHADFRTSLQHATIDARGVAKDTAAEPERRSAALQLVGSATNFVFSEPTFFVEFLTPQTPTVLQLDAVRILGGTAERDSLGLLLAEWNSFAPAVRAEVLAILLRRESSAGLLLDAVQAGTVSAADLDAPQRDTLLNWRSPELAARAKTLLESEDHSNRQDVVDSYREQLAALQGDATAGRAIFEKRCSNCHRLLELGKEVGPDLAALKDRSTEALLTAVLDPNRAVESKFQSYVVITTDGLQHSGMLKSESGGSLTLIGNDGKELTVPRANIEQLASSRRSLMPEGLEKDVAAKDLADIFAFVRSSGTPWKRFDGNAPQMVLAADDGTITLPASAAEIYGPSLVFEHPHGNLGYWQSTDDYARWTLDVPRSGHWQVEFEFACDDGTAGNLIRLSTGTRMLTARVPGSGTWDNYQTWRAGTIDLRRGPGQLLVTAPDKPPFALVDLRAIRLIPPE